MTFMAFWLILISVVLHASWNFVCKSHRPSIPFFAQSKAASALVLLPILLWINPDFSALPLEFYLALTGGAIANAVYYASLANAYSRGDISMVYPMARSLPVILIAAVTAAFMPGEAKLHWQNWAGLVLIFGGCLLLPLPSLKDFNFKTYRTPLLGFIILAACGTTSYMILDDQGMSLAKEALALNKFQYGCMYMALQEPLICLILLIMTGVSAASRQELRQTCFRSPWPAFTGIAGFGAYVLVLTAMPFVTNVSLVYAFRQMSLPLGVAAGIVILHERCTLTKILGCLAIVGGLILNSL
ncbi:MAG: hypothetical protein E7047_07595 [Lentisphaerae bacterium]|nr:hypothetical protein [Lentisphaerota bacterium]